LNELSEEEERQLLSEIVKLDSAVFGLIFGLILGIIIFIATNWLVMAGGHVNPQGKVIIGPHLALLGQFFIGYKVTFLGSIIGFIYGFATGSILGTLIAWFYNKIVNFRNKRV